MAVRDGPKNTESNGEEPSGDAAEKIANDMMIAATSASINGPVECNPKMIPSSGSDE